MTTPLRPVPLVADGSGMSSLFDSPQERAEVAEGLRKKFELDRMTARALVAETGYSDDLVRELLYEAGVMCIRCARARRNPRAEAARQQALKRLRRA